MRSGVKASRRAPNGASYVRDEATAGGASWQSDRAMGGELTFHEVQARSKLDNRQTRRDSHSICSKATPLKSNASLFDARDQPAIHLSFSRRLARGLQFFHSPDILQEFGADSEDRVSSALILTMNMKSPEARREHELALAPAAAALRALKCSRRHRERPKRFSLI